MTRIESYSSNVGSNIENVPRVAIVGTEGAGKTVLTCVLAKRFNLPNSHGFFLNPQGVTTLKYVERVWNTLQSQDWPPSTAPGELFALQWTIQKNDQTVAQVRVLDAAGQDLRRLFEEEQILAHDSLPKHLRRLAEYCRRASVVLFLVNLGDVIGVGDSERRAANEAAIKSALDILLAHSSSRRACIVLTQADLYRDYARECGGWMQLAAKHIPYIYTAYLATGKVKLFAVAAVEDTQVVYDAEGKPRRVPARNFRSAGVKKLFEWLISAITQATVELRRREEQRLLRERAKRERAERERAEAERAERERAEAERAERERAERERAKQKPLEQLKAVFREYPVTVATGAALLGVVCAYVAGLSPGQTLLLLGSFIVLLLWLRI